MGNPDYGPGNEDYEYDLYRERRDELGLIDLLVYINYAHNRDRSPDITVERWQRVYGENTGKLEEMYQAEKSVAKEAA